MKNIFFLVIFFCSCSKIIMYDESNIQNCPCKPISDDGINVIVKNNGQISFSKFTLILDNNEIVFGGLKKGKTSCNKSMPYIYQNNHFKINFTGSKNQVHNVIISESHKGQKITKGRVLIEVETTGSIDDPNVQIKTILR